MYVWEHIDLVRTAKGVSNYLPLHENKKPHLPVLNHLGVPFGLPEVDFPLTLLAEGTFELTLGVLVSDLLSNIAGLTKDFSDFFLK